MYIYTYMEYLHSFMAQKPTTDLHDLRLRAFRQVRQLQLAQLAAAERHDKVLAWHARCSDIPWRCTWGIRDRRVERTGKIMPFQWPGKKTRLCITGIECQWMLRSFALRVKLHIRPEKANWWCPPISLEKIWRDAVRTPNAWSSGWVNDFSGTWFPSSTSYNVMKRLLPTSSQNLEISGGVADK